MQKQASAQRKIVWFIFTILTLTRKINGQYVPRCNLLVAQDGTGNFKTITDAILAAPDFSPQRFYIKIKAGTYNENIVIDKSKTNLTLIGDGMDQTIISGCKHKTEGIETSDTGTAVINADGFVAQDITFQNIAGPEAEQAVALLSRSSYSALFRCRFVGYQDTLYASHGIQFFRECEIYGTVDIIFGDARAVFQNCKIYARRPLPGQSNTVTAEGRKSENGDGGFVIHNCIISATPDLITAEYPVRTYLGRPWEDYSRTVVMQSYIDAFLDPKGWLEWQGEEARMNTLYYAEYDNKGAGALPEFRVAWPGYKLLYNITEAAQFTVRNFISGDLWIPLTGVPYCPDLIGTGVPCCPDLIAFEPIIEDFANRILKSNNDLIMVVTISFYLILPF